MAQTKPSETLDSLLVAATAGELTETQWRQLHPLGPEAVTLVGLAMGRRIIELQDRLNATGPATPSTPSGQVPIYTKPAAPKRRRRPGARRGHKGSRRPTPEQIDRRVEHRLDVCPCCGGPVQRCQRTRARIIEDIPADNGAATQAVLMSIYRTLKLRGHNPMDAIADALRTYLTTGQLPPLPAPVIASG